MRAPAAAASRPPQPHDFMRPGRMHGKGTYVDGKGEIFEGEFFNGNGVHSPLSPRIPPGV